MNLINIIENACTDMTEAYSPKAVKIIEEATMEPLPTKEQLHAINVLIKWWLEDSEMSQLNRQDMYNMAFNRVMERKS